MQSKPCMFCLGLYVAEDLDFAAGMDLTGGLELAWGVGNALGEARHPC